MKETAREKIVSDGGNPDTALDLSSSASQSQPLLNQRSSKAVLAHSPTHIRAAESDIVVSDSAGQSAAQADVASSKVSSKEPVDKEMAEEDKQSEKLSGREQ